MTVAWVEEIAPDTFLWRGAAHGAHVQVVVRDLDMVCFVRPVYQPMRDEFGRARVVFGVDLINQHGAVVARQVRWE